MIELPGTLNTADVLAALYNAAAPKAMGFLQYDPTPMTREEAAELLEHNRSGFFDYVKGRAMKIGLKVGASELDSETYDEYNGQCLAAKVIITLILSGEVNHFEIAAYHQKQTRIEAMAVKNKIQEPTRSTNEGGFTHVKLGLADAREVLEPKVNEVLKKNVKET